MKGPLAPEIYDTSRAVGSWWEEEAGPDPDPAPMLEGEARTDTAIIGGGYAGLSAALRLAELGVGATVLDAAPIGWGASGRNGGIAGFGGYKLSRGRLTRRFGEEEPGRIATLQAEHLRRLRRFCTEAWLGPWVQGESEALWAHSARAARDIAEEAEDGMEAEALPPSGQPDIARHGGIGLGPAFGIQPLRLVRALAAAAREAGAEVHAESPVTAWRQEGARHLLQTPRGTLSAGRVLIATNGFTSDGLHAEMEARAVPVISNIGVTRVLSNAERTAHPWLDERPMSDTRNLLAYFRMLPEGRLLFGIRGDPTGSERGATRVQRRLRAEIDRALPGLAGAEITHFWRGPICTTLGLRPSIGEVPGAGGVFHAFGWHGSGICSGTLGGRLVAELIARGDAEGIPPSWRGLPPRVPLPGMRPTWVALAQAGYGLADRV